MMGVPLELASIRAVYFDLDDTLCTYWDAAKQGLLDVHQELLSDSVPFETFRSSWAAEFRDYCFQIKKTDWYERYLASGEPTRTELMRRTLTRMGLDHQFDAKAVGDRYAELRLESLHLFEGAEALVAASASKLATGLITNGPADVQRQEVERFGLQNQLGQILIEGELGFGKPDPRVFQLAESHCNLPASAMVFVGNSYRHDIEPAIYAGWQTVWIRRASDVAPSVAAHDAKPEELPPGCPEPSLTCGSCTELLKYFNFYSSPV